MPTPLPTPLRSDARRTALVVIGVTALLAYAAGKAYALSEDHITPLLMMSLVQLPWYVFDLVGLLGAALYVGLLAETLRSLNAPLTRASTSLVVLTALGTITLISSATNTLLIHFTRTGDDFPWLLYLGGDVVSGALGFTLAVVATAGRQSVPQTYDGRQRGPTLVTIGTAATLVLLLGLTAWVVPMLGSHVPGDELDLSSADTVESLVAAGISAVVYVALLVGTVATRHRPLGGAVGVLVVLTAAGTAHVIMSGLSYVFTQLPLHDIAVVWIVHVLAQWASVAVGAWLAVVATADRPAPRHEPVGAPEVTATSAPGPTVR